MTQESDNFEWLGANDAETILRKRLLMQHETPDTLDLTVIGMPGSANDYEITPIRDVEPRAEVNSYLLDAEKHLDALWVVGSSNLTDEEIQYMGPYLAREESYREDAVFQILARRRAGVPAYLRPYITVKKEHILQYGLGAQAGRISLEGIQRDHTTAARALLEPLVDPDEFEDIFLLKSDIMRRVLRALYYILSEPTESTALFFDRLKRQVEESGPLSAEELVARVYNFTQTQYEKHVNNYPTKLETEETLLQLLEEGRLHRLKNLGSTALVSGLGIITAFEYGNGE